MKTHSIKPWVNNGLEYAKTMLTRNLGRRFHKFHLFLSCPRFGHRSARLNFRCVNMVLVSIFPDLSLVWVSTTCVTQKPTA